MRIEKHFETYEEVVEYITTTEEAPYMAIVPLEDGSFDVVYSSEPLD